MIQWFLNELCVSLIFHAYATVSKLEKIDLMSCKPYRVCSSLLSLITLSANIFFSLPGNIVKTVRFFSASPETKKGF